MTQMFETLSPMEKKAAEWYLDRMVERIPEEKRVSSKEWPAWRENQLENIAVVIQYVPSRFNGEARIINQFRASPQFKEYAQTDEYKAYLESQAFVEEVSENLQEQMVTEVAAMVNADRSIAGEPAATPPPAKHHHAGHKGAHRHNHKKGRH